MTLQYDYRAQGRDYLIQVQKQRERARAEAGFWKRNYAESVRAQRIWELKQREKNTIASKL